MKRIPVWLVALSAYLLVSVFYFAVPVAAHPGRNVIGTGHDPNLFIWMVAWWPHALLHGTNPVVTHAVWAPHGANLAWDTSIPGLALLATPVTLLGGPVLAYNALVVLMPALAAWTAFLLCRHLTHSFWASLAGGYLFGFSPYVLGQTAAHIHMSSVFLVPLIALVLIRYVEGSLSVNRFVVALGVLLAFQISFSTELAFTVTLAIAVSLALAALLIPASRRRLRLLLPPLLLSYAVAAILASPLLAYALLHFQHGALHPVSAYPADLLNLVIPTRQTALGWDWTRTVSHKFKGNLYENGAYLGIPVLVILAWFGWRFRRTPAARFLVALLVVGVVVELGIRLEVGRQGSINLPWRLVYKLPLLENVLPVRISMFVALAASVCVAWWASSPGVWRAARLTLTALAIASVVPSLWLTMWHTHAYRPPFFTHGLYRACLSPNDNVLMLPSPNRSSAMLWQAESRFAFRMADGYVSTRPPPGVPHPEVFRLRRHHSTPASVGPLLAWARSQGVTKILVAGSGARGWNRLLSQAETPHRIGGVDLYDLRPTANASAATGPCA